MIQPLLRERMGAPCDTGRTKSELLTAFPRIVRWRGIDELEEVRPTCRSECALELVAKEAPMRLAPFTDRLCWCRRYGGLPLSSSGI